MLGQYSTEMPWSTELRLPLIAAPMTQVSGLELIAAVTDCGVAGSFPVHNAGSLPELDRWLGQLYARDPSTSPGPVVPNLIVHRTNPRLAEEVSTVAHHGVPAVITSVGSPSPVIGPLHDAGIEVFSDVASMRHVHRAIEAGVDGLVLLTAGAGGQTGWANPLAFIRAVRKVWDGPVVLAGGVADGTSLLAALVAGYDLAYMGTAFIATTESAAPQPYKQAVVTSSLDDIELTSRFTGIPTSMIRSAEEAEGPDRAGKPYDATVLTRGAQPTSSVFSAGHSVAGIQEVVDTAGLINRVEREFEQAVARTRPTP
jgi:nitronate monooxygenase